MSLDALFEDEKDNQNVGQKKTSELDKKSSIIEKPQKKPSNHRKSLSDKKPQHRSRRELTLPGDDEIQTLLEKKIGELLPAALLNLVKIGYNHQLSLENMKQYFKETGQAKLYNLIRYFSDAKPRDVEEMLDYLYKNNYLIKTGNRWYKLNPKARD